MGRDRSRNASADHDAEPRRQTGRRARREAGGYDGRRAPRAICGARCGAGRWLSGRQALHGCRCQCRRGRALRPGCAGVVRGSAAGEGVAGRVPGPPGVQGDVGETGRRAGVSSYFNAEKRLSNELLETIGCAPAIAVPDVLAVGCSPCGTGFACAVAAGLVSAGFGAGAGFDTFFASITRGFAGGALAVVSEPPIPILRARLVKKPSDFAEESAEATRVA